MYTKLITTELIKSYNPCQSRLDSYMKHYSEFSGTIKEFLQLSEITYHDKVWIIHKHFSKEVIVKWRYLCAESVLHIFESKYPNDLRPRIAVEASLNNRMTLKIKQDAAAAAYAAAYAAYAAIDAAIDAAAYAAYAAAAAAAVDAAAYAAYTAAAAAVDAAAYAAYAAAAAAVDAAAYAAYAAAAAAYTAAVKKQQQKNLNLFLVALGEV